ncbi:DUF930 domain-containing protein [Phyllobacterium salinisoli]|uniref:DUF930 domain-containing protein n=2 Tax=Phyllobacterium salinisoli TaxID=1899321 RepID=A0A368K2D5_9HYPH|nr:DUF930 domain-containing protein [Phyllobacterium salinisoli]
MIWAVAASLALHALIAVALSLIPAMQPPELPPEEAVTVEIVMPPPSPPVPPAVQELAVPRKAPETSEPRAEKPADPPAMVHATNLFSAKMLADPRNRQARQALAQLAGPDRIEQICDAEAMEQIQRWRQNFKPDRLVAYAMSGTRTDGATLIADGAAFRSKSLWYNVKFKCEMAANLRKIASFEFQVGAPIPRAEWETHNLSAVH